MTPEEIKQHRRDLRLTQTEMAAELGYGDRKRVSDIERGITIPNGAVVLLLKAYAAGYRPKDWPGGEA